jgi:hypothetical protein
MLYHKFSSGAAPSGTRWIWPQDGSRMGNPLMKSNEKPIAPSEHPLSNKPIDSPEFRASALKELRWMIEKGLIKSTQFGLAEPQPNLPAKP